MTKKRILDVATEEFSKRGYSAVSMNDLVKILSLNKATIYYHYKDKRALYQEVLKTSMLESKINKQKSIETMDNPKEKFRAYLKGFTQTIKDKPYTVGLWMHEIANFGSNMDESLTPIIEDMITFLEGLLQQLPLRDEYKDINPYVVFSMIHGFIDNFYATQMCPLPIGGDDKLKLNNDLTLNFLGDFSTNFILNALCKEGKE